MTTSPELVEVLPRHSEKLRKLRWSPRTDIGAKPHVAFVSDAGRSAYTSRFVRYVSPDPDPYVVVRYVPLEEVRVGRPNPLVIAARAVRAETLVASLFPVLLGLLIGGAAPSVPVLAAVLAVVLLHAAANLANEAYKHVFGTDALVRGDAPEVLARGWVEAGTLIFAAGLLGLTGILFGAWTVAVTGRTALLLVGFAGALAGWQFSAAPLRLGRTPLGDLAVLLFFGPALSASSAYLASGALSRVAVLAGLCAGFSAELRHLIRTLRRLPDEAATGSRPLAAVLGFARGKQAIIAVSALAVVWAAATGAPLALLSAPLLAFAVKPALDAIAPRDTRISMSARRYTWFAWAYAALILGSFALA